MPQDRPTELSFDSLPRYRPRAFVPEDADLTRADQAAALMEKLLARPITSADDLTAWVMDRSELGAALAQTGSILRIRMTCQTDDQSRAAAFREFVETVEPAVKPLSDRLDRKYLEERERFPLDERRYEVYDRGVRADVELFREENVPLQTEEAVLTQDYQTVCGAMTVEFDGEERTLPQMSKYLLETDRDVREGAWRATAARRLRDKQKIEEIFEKLLSLRARIAANAGFEDFRDYQFREYHRFDYTPDDCRRYHEAVERRVAPLWADILRKRRERMGLDALRPWDTKVDPEGRPRLKPFDRPEEFISGVQRMFERTDASLGAQFAQISEMGLLDLASRKGKAPGGYQSTLCEARKPFIFMNAVGVDGDVRTLLHEGGHAFHALASADDPLLTYRHAPIEFCEVASMSMELLGGESLDVFYDEDDARRSKREHLEDVAFILPWVATIDAFQFWLYGNPDHAAEERREAWLETFDRFNGGVVDWDGLEEERAYLWHRQLHIFEIPFYYIEYGIAQLGALQLWLRAKQDRVGALAAYKRALALGGSRPLPDLFKAAGLRFDFSEETIAPLMDAVGDELARL